MLKKLVLAIFPKSYSCSPAILICYGKRGEIHAGWSGKGRNPVHGYPYKSERINHYLKKRRGNRSDAGVYRKIAG
jgi:hypothetical protein